MSKRDEFKAFMAINKKAVPNITNEAREGYLNLARTDYGLTTQEAEKILKDVGLTAGPSVNYFEVLQLNVDEIRSLSDSAAERRILEAYNERYVELRRMPNSNPRKAERQYLLAQAKVFLIDDGKWQRHLQEVKGEVAAADNDNEKKDPPRATRLRKVVGIDLGMTSAAIAHVNEYGDPRIIPNAEMERKTPAVILFEDDIVVVGEVAKRNARAMPDQVVEFVKREMGKSVGVSDYEFSRDFNGKTYSAEELSALIIEKLKQDAEAYLGTEVTDAVITVPIYFNNAERQATRNAGEIAGLNVLRVLNEPTAAAFAYGLGQQGDEQTVFVFDLSGGTFDVTIMKIYESTSGDESTFKMIATDGDHRLGGKDWDDRIITYVADQFALEHGVNPLDDNFAYQDLQLDSIAAKEILSSRHTTRVVCNYSGKNSNVKLTREQFEALTIDLVKRCRSLCDSVLLEAKMTWTDMDQILLVGGSTRMPMIQKMLTNISGKEIRLPEVNPEDVVALGAAMSIEWGRYVEYRDLATHSTEYRDLATHSTGMKRVNGEGKEYFDVVIPKMTPIPCERVIDFNTVEPNQEDILIKIYEGLEQDQLFEEITDPEAFKLGDCHIKLPPKLPEGSTIRVTFKKDANQILEVTAEEPDGRAANVMTERPTLAG